MSLKFRKIKNIIWSLLNKIKLGGGIELTISGGLKSDGWFKSFYAKESIDINNKPIPWFTYSSLKFIEKRITSDLNIFEFGSGNSSLWFASRVNSICSVEHDTNWYNKVIRTKPNNSELRLIKKEEYSDSISLFNKKFDIIIIDGIERTACCRSSVNFLTQKGIIILDNSDRSEYKQGINFLLNSGFKELEFTGNAPIVSIYSSTSIFYRPDNIFNI